MWYCDGANTRERHVRFPSLLSAILWSLLVVGFVVRIALPIYYSLRLHWILIHCGFLPRRSIHCHNNCVHSKQSSSIQEDFMRLACLRLMAKCCCCAKMLAVTMRLTR